MTKEEWKDIPGYEGYYQISNIGRVKSLERLRKNGVGSYIQKEKILKQSKTTTGYYKVDLKINNIRKCFKTHRLVAQAFISNVHNKPYINHLDGNPLNNVYTNLEWCTQQENVIHAIENNLTKTIKIEEQLLRHLYVDENMGLTQVAKECNCSISPVDKCLKKYGIKKHLSGAQRKYMIKKDWLLEELKTKTQRQIADELGCDSSLISHYIKGDVTYA